MSHPGIMVLRKQGSNGHAATEFGKGHPENRENHDAQSVLVMMMTDDIHHRSYPEHQEIFEWPDDANRLLPKPQQTRNNDYSPIILLSSRTLPEPSPPKRRRPTYRLISTIMIA